jgi:seryl-tRNA synthetase
MYDIEKIRENPEWLDNGLKKRGLAPLSSDILALDTERRALQTSIQEALAKRNDLSRQIGEVKKSGGNADELMAQVAALKEQVPADEAKEAEIAEKLITILSSYPNIPADDVPVGKDEAENKLISEFLSPTKFQFNDIKDHVAIGEANGLIDFPAAVKMSGSRFVVTKGAIARLERALANFGLDMLTNEFGYTEVQAPLLVNDAAAYGTANLPKFEEDLFKTNTGHWLISTSEMSMTNLMLDTITDAKDLPIRLTSYTPCFRSEAGSAGRDTRGMIRVHQFYKVEQVVITTPDKSEEEHERMVSIAEEGLKRLKLPYQKMLLCSGDMGFASKKTYDINTWIPTQDTFRETMSCSNCGDFQARRMKARYRPEGSKKTEFVHTLNATLFATGRALVAIIENYQQADGSIKVPDVLVPYMNGLEVIK